MLPAQGNSVGKLEIALDATVLLPICGNFVSLFKEISETMAQQYDIKFYNPFHFLFHIFHILLCYVFKF